MSWRFKRELDDPELLGITVEKTFWNVWLPDDRKLQSSSGNMEPVLAEVKRAVTKANKQLAPFEQIRKFRILDRDFSQDAGELTPTMKVRRIKVIENFRNHIIEMYAGKEENV